MQVRYFKPLPRLFVIILMEYYKYKFKECYNVCKNEVRINCTNNITLINGHFNVLEILQIMTLFS